MNIPFTLSDALATISEVLASAKDPGRLQEFQGFLTGEKSISINQLPKLVKDCSLLIQVQFPYLAADKIDSELSELQEMLRTPIGEKAPRYLVLGWLSGLAQRYDQSKVV